MFLEDWAIFAFICGTAAGENCKSKLKTLPHSREGGNLPLTGAGNTRTAPLPSFRDSIDIANKKNGNRKGERCRGWRETLFSKNIRRRRGRRMRGARVVFWRDMTLLGRRPGDWLIPLLFFLMTAAMFSLALGPDKERLRNAAPGAIWAAALLSSLLSQDSLFRADSDDGALEQMLLSGRPPILLALAKTAAHWLSFGAPLTCMSPLLGAWFSLSANETLRLAMTLPLGTGVFSLLSVFAAALLVGGRRNHFLGAALCLPLCLPTVIFAAAATRGETAPLLLLAAMLTFSATILPVAAAGALRLGMER